MPVITYSKAINQALEEEMRRDENVILYGQDVAECWKLNPLLAGFQSGKPARLRVRRGGGSVQEVAVAP